MWYGLHNIRNVTMTTGYSPYKRQLWCVNNIILCIKIHVIGAIRWFRIISSMARTKPVLRQAASNSVTSVKAYDICCGRFRDRKSVV
jgi:uncharacterized membrane protein YidH (DUF202 family)